jgi:dolichyl-diphosphooligosaccharide--protein glycosyltransferase
MFGTAEENGSPTFRNSTAYKMMFNKWDEYDQGSDVEKGFDRARGYPVKNINAKFSHFEEAFTSREWLVRIYKVKDRPNKDPRFD